MLELPAKLSEYRAGFRYFQTYFGKLPWLRASTDTKFLLDTIEKIRNRPLLSDIANKMMYYYANITFEDYDEIFCIMKNWPDIQYSFLILCSQGRSECNFLVRDLWSLHRRLR